MSDQSIEVINQLDNITTLDKIKQCHVFIHAETNEAYIKINDTGADNVMHVEKKKTETMPDDTPAIEAKKIKLLILKI